MTVRTFIAVACLVHGFAHIVGPVAPYRLFDRHVVGEPATRVLEFLWLVAGPAFVLAGAAALRAARFWPGLATTVAGAALMLCLLAWPDARLGVALNLMLLLLLVVATRRGWLADVKR